MNNFKLEPVGGRDMPNIGDITTGKDLGKKTYHKYIWLACSQCRKRRWVETGNIREASYTGLCRQCNRKLGGWRRIQKVNPHGEGRVIKDGYVAVLLELDDFFYPMAHSRGYVLEHRLIMAKHLNRCLLPWEVVHHKNGIRNDNRLQNLELLPTGRQHLSSMRWQKELAKRDERLKQLEQRVTLLEAENAALMAGKIYG